MRVVSLLPSATELLCAAGGESLLVGRSHECDYPAAITDRPVLTGQKTTASTSAAIDQQVRAALASNGEAADQSLYTLDAELLTSLAPDLILTQDLCEVCSIDLNTVRSIARTMQTHPAILSLNPHTLDDVFDDLLRVGEAIGHAEAAREALSRLRERYWQHREFVNAYVQGDEVAFLEWIDPLFVGGHWTPQLIEHAGGRHSLNAPGEKSRQITADELVEAAPDRIIICPCGYSLGQIRRELHVLTGQPWWRQLPAVKADCVVMVDGNQMFNRPGPRLIDAFCWLVSWLNDRPQLTPANVPVEPVAIFSENSEAQP